MMNHILNNIYRLLLVMAMTSMACACSDETELPVSLVSGDPGTMTLRFTSAEMSRSVNSDKSELRITNLAVGLYPEGFVDESAPVYWNVFKNLNESSSATITLRLTQLMEQQLFRGEDGANCRLFALANVPDIDDLPFPATIAQMKAWPVSSPFFTQDEQSSFIMTADGTVTYKAPASDTERGTASGDVKLVRAAAKITLNLSFPENIEIKDEAGNVVETWTIPVSSDDGIRVFLNNGVKDAVAYPVTTDNTPWSPAVASAYASGNLSNAASVRTLKNTGTGTYPYQMDVPLYTYPNAWEENIDEKHKTMLTLVVPWQRNGESSYSTFYYHVPVTPADITHIARNHSYIINLNVGILGSIVPDTPQLLDDLSYKIVDWGNEQVDVKIDDIRYLVVNPSEYVINNETEFSIPFYTSHPVEISDYTITYPQFNVYNTGATEKRGLPVDIIMKKEVIDRSEYTHDNITDTIATFNIVRDPQTNQMTLKVKHELVMWLPRNSSNGTVSLVTRINNNTGTITSINNQIYRYVRPENPSSSYYPYTIRVTIRHKDEGYRDTYKEEVTITQYPGMYITVDRNPGGSYYTNNGSDTPWNVATRPLIDHGYAFVNPYEETYNDEICWVNDRSLGGLITYSPSGRRLSSPCMYIIHVTQFDESMRDQYVIGNPRSKLINNLNYTGLSDDEIEEDLNIEDSAPAEKWILNGSGPAATTSGWCREANALYDDDNGSTRRTLEYYYPTIESDETKNMVAPLYRFASSYGGLISGNKLKAPETKKLGRRRVATYQERQCASGRWRLPTYGEFRLIVWLSVTQRIPSLFNSDQPYLTAHGAVRVEEGTGNLLPIENRAEITLCNARGVYDDWYWNEETEYILNENEDGSFTYTLGDMPARTVTQNN